MNVVQEQLSPGAGRKNSAVSFRHPEKSDGEKIWRLVGSCPPLDENSLYCNLLQCSHFSKTCLIAEEAGEIIGWVSSYRPPSEPETLFVWQVAISASARGRGVGKSLIVALVSADGARGAIRIQTTITKSNKASWSVFGAAAKALGAQLTHEDWLDRDADFGGRHETERLVTIGPIAPG